MSVLETAQAAAKRKKKKAVRRSAAPSSSRVHGRVVKKRVCTTPKKRKKVVVRRPGPSPASPPATTPTGPLPVPPDSPPAAGDPMVYSGAFGRRAGRAPAVARRLRAQPGPGRPALEPRPQGRDPVADAAVGRRGLTGPEPSDNGDPLEPLDRYGHDHLWWLDRMVRTDQHLVERMALIFHDWFGLRRDDVGQMDLVMAHIDLFRTQGLGSFRDLLMAVTNDPAMLLFLSGANSDENHPNENYGREVQELFTLGADRGAYTETDVREAARALTGWRADYVDEIGWTNFHYDPSAHDNRNKTIFGHTGNFDWRDVVDLCIGNPYHRSHFVLKMWSYFVPGARRTRRRRPRSRSSTSTATGRSAPSSRRSSPTRRCTRGPPMVKSPVALQRRPAARDRQAHRLDRPHVLVARTPASGCSTRRTSRAGTTTPGSTRRRSTTAGASSTTCSTTASSRATATTT